MYTVTIQNGSISANIHDVNTDLRIQNAAIEQTINNIHKFSFSINILHQNYRDVKEKLTRVRVFSDKTVFDGYVLKIQEFMDGSGKFHKSVVCESAIGYLYDSVQPYKNYEKTTFKAFLTAVLNVHNSMVEDFKKISLGTVIEPPDNVKDYVTNYGKSYTVLDGLLADFGGEFQLENVGNGYILNYHHKEIMPSNSAENPIIELARNLQSMETFVDGSQVITKLYPYGAKAENSESRLDIAKINGGLPYLLDENAAEMYGIICGVQTWDEITDPAALKIRGQIFLGENNKVKKSYKITALDLSTVGLDFKEFQLGGKYHLINPIMGIDTRKSVTDDNPDGGALRIIKLTIDLNAPQKSAIEIGDRVQGISSISAEMANTLKYKLPEQQAQTVAQATASAVQVVDVKTADFLTKVEAEGKYAKLTDLGSFASISAVNSALNKYVVSDDLAEILEDYIKKDDEIDGSLITGKLSGIKIETDKIKLDGYDLACKIVELEQKIADIEERLPTENEPETEE